MFIGPIVIQYLLRINNLSYDGQFKLLRKGQEEEYPKKFASQIRSIFS